MILHEIIYCSVRPIVVDGFRGRDELAASAAVDSAIVVLVANAVDAAK